jgi:carboxypeptidase C (cathepsin A)
LRIKPEGPTTVPSIVCEVRRNRARLAQYRIIQTIRILSRSHRRFTEERKVKVFRSLIKETRITASGVELEMYLQPTQNVWWKYRQKKLSIAKRSGKSVVDSLRINVPSMLHARVASHLPTTR